VAQLEDRHRRFIVTRLACFESPSQVAEAVRERFGIDVPRQQVYGYDAAAAKGTGRRIAPHWRELFWESRRRYLADVAGIGVANKGFRLRRLDELFRKAEQSGNIRLAAALLEQAAREMCDADQPGAPFDLTALAHLLGVNPERLPYRETNSSPEAKTDRRRNR
jgi:hypothetical protein